MSKHTEGPWRIRENPDEGRIDVCPEFDGQPEWGEWAPICVVEDSYGDDLAEGAQEYSQTLPNARLIAAAPDLKRELEEMPCIRPMHGPYGGVTVRQCLDAGECGCSAGAAIAKAEGRL